MVKTPNQRELFCFPQCLHSPLNPFSTPSPASTGQHMITIPDKWKTWWKIVELFSQRHSCKQWKTHWIMLAKMLKSGFEDRSWWHHWQMSLMSTADNLPYFVMSTNPKWWILLISAASNFADASWRTLLNKPAKLFPLFLSEHNIRSRFCKNDSDTCRPTLSWSRRCKTWTKMH